MIPFFIFYSMFGFQRVGDLIWAFGDIRGRGFLLGATAGRTTLNGEGLQHEEYQRSGRARLGTDNRFPGTTGINSRPSTQEPQADDLGLCRSAGARGGGLEPPMTGPEPVVLPIT